MSVNELHVIIIIIFVDAKHLHSPVSNFCCCHVALPAYSPYFHFFIFLFLLEKNIFTMIAQKQVTSEPFLTRIYTKKLPLPLIILLSPRS